MLAKDGRHAPVILDDALVFTDDDRIERMFDALHRHAGDLQIIVLNRSFFGKTNPAYRRKINFMKMTEQAIEALSEDELSAALADRGVDVSKYEGKAAKVKKALMM